MEFKKIQLNGFKSFAEKTNFLIEEGLTGIVGPNGCGKSNIVESLRWVMGETSAKSMRGSGMEDVIFSGTSNKASKNIAEVSIEVENKEKEGPIQYRELENIQVRRKIEKDKGSKFYINDKEVSTDEYMAYYNMSYAEKLKNYGVTIEKAAGGMVVVPKMDDGGEASEGESKLGAMFEFANDYRQMMTRKVMALSQLLALPIKAVGISIVSVIAKVGSMFAKFLPGPLKSMIGNFIAPLAEVFGCLLYTSDAADE